MRGWIERGDLELDEGHRLRVWAFGQNDRLRQQLEASDEKDLLEALLWRDLDVERCKDGLRTLEFELARVLEHDGGPTWRPPLFLQVARAWGMLGFSSIAETLPEDAEALPENDNAYARTQIALAMADVGNDEGYARIVSGPPADDDWIHDWAFVYGSRRGDFDRGRGHLESQWDPARCDAAPFAESYVGLLEDREAASRCLRQALADMDWDFAMEQVIPWMWGLGDEDCRDEALRYVRNHADEMNEVGQVGMVIDAWHAMGETDRMARVIEDANGVDLDHWLEIAATVKRVAPHELGRIVAKCERAAEHEEVLDAYGGDLIRLWLEANAHGPARTLANRLLEAWSPKPQVFTDWNPRTEYPAELESALLAEVLGEEVVAASLKRHEAAVEDSDEWEYLAAAWRALGREPDAARCESSPTSASPAPVVDRGGAPAPAAAEDDDPADPGVVAQFQRLARMSLIGGVSPQMRAVLVSRGEAMGLSAGQAGRILDQLTASLRELRCRSFNR